MPAPTFMIGAALGAGGTPPAGARPGFWALAGLAAVLGGVVRSPLTGVVFPLELTDAWPLLLPLLVAAGAAYVVSALLLKRSVLTETVARRGLHLTREYSIDPLEVILVAEVMRPVDAVSPAGPAPDVIVHPDETLRHAVNCFAVSASETAWVVSRSDPGAPIGCSRWAICWRPDCVTTARSTSASGCSASAGRGSATDRGPDPRPAATGRDARRARAPGPAGRGPGNDCDTVTPRPVSGATVVTPAKSSPLLSDTEQR